MAGGSLASSTAPEGQRGDGPAIEEFELRIERLRAQYELYFMGQEKAEPRLARTEVERLLAELRRRPGRSTATRYRVQSLGQRWNVYATYWDRTLRAIEAGTYIRNVARVGREAARRGVEVPSELLRAMPARMRQRVQSEQARGEVRAAPSSPVGEDAAVLELYRRYVAAKHALGEDPRSVRYEDLCARVREQERALADKYGVDTVEFTVDIQEGRVVLRALPGR